MTRDGDEGKKGSSDTRSGRQTDNKNFRNYSTTEQGVVEPVSVLESLNKTEIPGPLT